MKLSFFQIVFLLVLFFTLFCLNSSTLSKFLSNIQLLIKKLKKHNTTRK